MRRFRELKTVFLVLGMIFLTAMPQTMTGKNYAKTGPLQKVRVGVVNNNSCQDSTLQIISVLNPLTEGTATVVSGGYIEFVPGINCRDTTVDILYSITCNGVQETDTLSVEVAKYNQPVNVIDKNVSCYNVMPNNIQFGIKEKFRTANTTGFCVDGFTSPLVGDLNGDGKPEIVAAGVIQAFSAGTATDTRYINIYNGQTGNLMIRYDLGANYRMGYPYHRAPSQLALADLDNDGIAEIVIALSNGEVRAYKPIFNGTSITTLNLMWQSTVNYAAPLTADFNRFGYPHPYIADLNGDGIPEIIIYNKIYNGATGSLLMSWQNAATTPKFSSIATGVGGLTDVTSAAPTTQTNANAVRNVAMTGRRPGNGTYSDAFLSVPVIIDIDGDGNQEIITGNRIHKFQFNSLTNHTLNTYTTIEGPLSVTITENPNGSQTTHYLTDGFTRVADIDGDKNLEVIVITPCDNGSLNTKILVCVWDPVSLTVKAASTFYSNGANGNFGIPFIGDINGKKDGWDGTAYTRKLPEICMIMGNTYINRATTNGGRSGLLFHPLAGTELLNGSFNSTAFEHIIGMTYDANAAAIDERLKLSWAMQHDDRSENTGMTLFDFDNNGTMDICYRDEITLRVISPANGNNGAGRDYVTLTETASTPGTSIMFSTPIFSGTGFEYPTIADVNMDGSADIVVMQSATARNVSAVAGFIIVFEYNGPKWAPCPPVWNQSMYNPTQVREDLKINARPQSMLTPYTINGDTIYPFNGSWVQQPIVKEGSDYVPVVRLPDAVLRNMKIEVLNTTSTRVTLTIANNGTATIGASAPISFYNGGQTKNPLQNSTFIETKQVGVDIFPKETVTLIYTISGNYNNCLIWCRIMDNGTQFPATGYGDCDTSNNTLFGMDCSMLTVSIIGPNSICVGNTTQLLPNTNGTWASSDSTIATVSNNGIVTGKSAGFATFSFTSSDNFCTKTTDTVWVAAFPTVYAITAEKNAVCENANMQLSCSTIGGVWTLSNNYAQIVGNSNDNPITVKGITEGKTYVSYTVGTGICKTTVTFLLKIVSLSPPEIKIGIEK